MDDRTLQGIEFGSVLKLLEARCASASGAAAAGALAPASSSFEVDTLLDETGEAVALLGAGEYLPLAAFDDPEEWLEDIRRRGGNLEGEKFLSILSLLNLASEVRRFVEERAERLPRLRMRIHGADMQYPLAARIRRILDERGEVRDDASTELQESRAKQRALRAEIRRLLDRIMNAHPNAIQENLIVQRRDRYLVPAKTTFKRSFEGVIQDRSASGETLFVEPLSAVPVNNAIAEEREAERAEVERILRELTAEVMAAREAIVFLVQCLAGLDLIWAKARLGVDWRGARAQASATPAPSLMPRNSSSMSGAYAAAQPMLWRLMSMARSRETGTVLLTRSKAMAAKPRISSRAASPIWWPSSRGGPLTSMWR